MQHKWQSYDVWFLRYGVQQTESFVILDHFLPFYPLTFPKNQNFQKMKKAPGNIVILHKYTKNHGHILYCSWDMTHYRCNCYFSFWAIFCPFTPSLPEKWKFQKKMKKRPGDIIILHKCTKNHHHMLCWSWDMVCDRCNCYFSFWAFFALPPNSPKNKNFKKMKKTPKDIIILHMCTINYCHIMYGSWDMTHNRWTDRQIEKVTYRDGCPT